MSYRGPSPILANLPSACSLLTSAAALWLIHVHGTLIDWWMKLQQEANVDAARYPSFFPLVDQVHYLAIGFAFLNLATAAAIWRWNVAHRLWSGIAALVATCTLLVCLFVRL